MNKLIFYLLSLTSSGIPLGQVRAQSSLDVDELSTCEHLSHQMDVLKSGNENLKLRLEMVEHNFERQRQHQRDVQKKFNTLEEMMQKLQMRLAEQQNDNHNEVKDLLMTMGSSGCNHDQTEFVKNSEKPDILKELQTVTKLQENILQKLETVGATSKDFIKADDKGGAEIEVSGVNVCWGVYTKILGELNSNMTILQNIDTKLKQLNENYNDEVAKHEKTIALNQGLLKLINKKEDAKICVRSNDQQLVCTAEPRPTSCADYDAKHCADGKCRIRNVVYGSESFLVPCDDASDGGGWTVIQRRINGSEDFYRGWTEYKSGFGNLDGEFWLGLDKIHAMTSTLAPVELLIQLKDHNDTMKYAKYGRFLVGSELESYELKEADDYEGNAGDSFGPHKGNKFSTKDNDNDVDDNFNCAVDKRGAWWYNKCQWSNLNGLYYKTGIVPKNETGRGIDWSLFGGYNYSLKFVQMMIRPKKTV